MPPSPLTEKVAESHKLASDDSGHVPADNAATPGNRKSALSAKKASRTLTPAQLEKKRANDREAQRAIRERTKNQIEQLEKRITDLESGATYRELEVALEQKEALQVENADIKKRLASIFDLLKPFLPEQRLQTLNVEQQPSPASIEVSSRKPSPSLTQTHNDREAQRPKKHLPNQERIPPTPSSGSSGLSRNETHPVRDPPHLAREYQSWQREGEFPYQSITATYPQSQYTPDATDGCPPSSATSPQSTSNYSLKRKHAEVDSEHRRQPGQANPEYTREYLPDEIANTRQQQQFPPYYAAGLPMNTPPTCRFDNILHDFRTMARRNLAEGALYQDVVGSPYPVFNKLVYGAAPSTKKQELSNLMVDMLRGFSAMDEWPEKIATCCYMFALWKYLITPTEEEFDRLPVCMRPTKDQQERSHPIWTDCIIWPEMRRRMTYKHESVPLDAFFYPYTVTVSVNWHSQDLLACVYQDENGDFVPRPDFWKHCFNPDNWTLGTYFYNCHPPLQGTYPVRDSSRRSRPSSEGPRSELVKTEPSSNT